MPRDRFDVRETPDGLFEVLFNGCPVDVGVAIECPFEADAFLRAVRGDLESPAAFEEQEAA